MGCDQLFHCFLFSVARTWICQNQGNESHFCRHRISRLVEFFDFCHQLCILSAQQWVYDFKH